MGPAATYRHHPLPLGYPLDEDRVCRRPRRRQPQYPRLTLTHAVHFPVLVDRHRVILTADHVDYARVQERRFQPRLVGVIHPPRVQRPVGRDGRRVRMSGRDADHVPPLEGALDRTGETFHRVHVGRESHAGAQLTLVVPAPGVHDPVDAEREAEGVTAGDAGYVLRPQQLHRFGMELVDRLEVTEAAVRSGPARQHLPLRREDRHGVFAAVHVGHDAPVLDEAIDEPREVLGVHVVAVSQTSESVDPRSAVAEGVQIAGGGQDGREVGTERRLDDRVG